MKMKRALSLICLICLLFVSVTNAQAAEIVSSKDTVVIANILDVGSIDPTNNVSDAGTRVRQWIFEPLLHLSLSSQQYENVLAESYEYEDDTHVTFHLRKGVTFHNGNPFTADDVLFSWQYYIEKGSYTPACIRDNIDLENCKIIDDHTITLATFKPDAILLQYLGDVNYGFIFDKETMEAGGNMAENPVGTGPYMFADYIVGDSVTLKANENYWGEKPYIENVIFRVIPEMTQRGIELETGGVDVATNLDVSEIEYLRDDPAYTVIEEPGVQVHNLFYNLAEGHPLSNPDLRKAVAYAINENALVAGGFGGAAVPASGVSSSNALGFLKFDDWYNYNVEAAKEHLAKAGYAEGELTLTMICDDDANRVGMCEVIMNNLNAIGINVNLVSSDFAGTVATATDPSHEGWDLFMLKNSKASAVMQLDWAYRNSNQFVAWDDPTFNELWDKAAQATDPELQLQNGNELQEYFYDQMPYYPMVVQIFYMAATSELENVESYDLMNARVPVLYFK